MTKLEQVRKALEADQRIVIVRVERDRDKSWSSFTQTVNFIVAPKEVMTESSELQALMMSLVPSGIHPDSIDNFDDFETRIGSGTLYFDEEFGYIRKRIEKETVLTDPNLSDCEGFANGKKVKKSTELLTRRIWVSVYPCVVVAIAAADGDRSVGGLFGSVLKSDLLGDGDLLRKKLALGR